MRGACRHRGVSAYGRVGVGACRRGGVRAWGACGRAGALDGASWRIGHREYVQIDVNDSPLRTPIRRHAPTPTRPYADTPHAPTVLLRVGSWRRDNRQLREKRRRTSPASPNRSERQNALCRSRPFAIRPRQRRAGRRWR
jgi:hypothetical protein